MGETRGSYLGAKWISWDEQQGQVCPLRMCGRLLVPLHLPLVCVTGKLWENLFVLQPETRTMATDKEREWAVIKVQVKCVKLCFVFVSQCRNRVQFVSERLGAADGHRSDSVVLRHRLRRFDLRHPAWICSRRRREVHRQQLQRLAARQRREPEGRAEPSDRRHDIQPGESPHTHLSKSTRKSKNRKCTMHWF